MFVYDIEKRHVYYSGRSNDPLEVLRYEMEDVKKLHKIAAFFEQNTISGEPILLGHNRRESMIYAVPYGLKSSSQTEVISFANTVLNVIYNQKNYISKDSEYKMYRIFSSGVISLEDLKEYEPLILNNTYFNYRKQFYNATSSNEDTQAEKQWFTDVFLANTECCTLLSRNLTARNESYYFSSFDNIQEDYPNSEVIEYDVGKYNKVKLGEIRKIDLPEFILWIQDGMNMNHYKSVYFMSGIIAHLQFYCASCLKVTSEIFNETCNLAAIIANFINNPVNFNLTEKDEESYSRIVDYFKYNAAHTILYYVTTNIGSLGKKIKDDLCSQLQYNCAILLKYVQDYIQVNDDNRYDLDYFSRIYMRTMNFYNEQIESCFSRNVVADVLRCTNMEVVQPYSPCAFLLSSQMASLDDFSKNYLKKGQRFEVYPFYQLFINKVFSAHDIECRYSVIVDSASYLSDNNDLFYSIEKKVKSVYGELSSESKRDERYCLYYYEISKCHKFKLRLPHDPFAEIFYKNPNKIISLKELKDVLGISAKTSLAHIQAINYLLDVYGYDIFPKYSNLDVLFKDDFGFNLSLMQPGCEFHNAENPWAKTLEDVLVNVYMRIALYVYISHLTLANIDIPSKAESDNFINNLCKSLQYIWNKLVQKRECLTEKFLNDLVEDKELNESYFLSIAQRFLNLYKVSPSLFDISAKEVKFLKNSLSIRNLSEIANITLTLFQVNKITISTKPLKLLWELFQDQRLFDSNLLKDAIDSNFLEDYCNKSSEEKIEATKFEQILVEKYKLILITKKSDKKSKKSSDDFVPVYFNVDNDKLKAVIDDTNNVKNALNNIFESSESDNIIIAKSVSENKVHATTTENVAPKPNSTKNIKAASSQDSSVKNTSESDIVALIKDAIELICSKKSWQISDFRVAYGDRRPMLNKLQDGLIEIQQEYFDDDIFDFDDDISYIGSNEDKAKLCQILAEMPNDELKRNFGFK